MTTNPAPRTPGPGQPSWSAPAPPTVAPRRRVPGGVLIALVVGLVVGGGGVGLGWLLSNNAGSGDQADAQAACDIINRVGPFPGGASVGTVDDFRWGAAYALTNAAVKEDGRYTALANAVQQAMKAINSSSGSAQINDLVSQAKAACTNL
jgi:hypothetical protein